MTKKQSKNFNKFDKTRSWVGTLRDPFNSPAAHIPDFDSTPSGLITSRFLFTHTPTALSGSSTVHNGGIVIFPNPRGNVVELAEFTAGSNNITDLGNGAGTTLFSSRDAPNLSGYGDAYKMRMVSCGLRITYGGTELNRSGEFIAGFMNTEYPATGLSSTGTRLSPISTLMGSMGNGYFSVSSIKNNLKNMKVERIGDKTIEFFWEPNGVPPYMRGANSTTYLPPYLTTAGAAVDPSFFASDLTGGGTPYSSNCMVVLITGDTVASAQTTGNIYDVEVISHWEVIPSNVSGVVYDLSPSHADPVALAAAVNGIALVPSPTQQVAASSYTYQKQNKTIVYNGAKTKTQRFVEDNSDTILRIAKSAASMAANYATRKAVQPRRRQIEL